ncbi:MAG: hypothetical protein H7831_15070 [Magnetococcus sp. WYHC-3]
MKRPGTMTTRERGAALLMALTAIAMVGAAVIGRKMADTPVTARQTFHNVNLMNQAKTALSGWAAQNAAANLVAGVGFLPCPAANATGNASALVGGECPALVGRLPWRTLGLENTRDASFSDLVYAVSRNHAGTPDLPLNSDTPGSIRVGNTTDIAALIVSPGPPIGNQTPGSSQGPALLDGGNAQAMSGNDTFAPGRLGSKDSNDQMLSITTDELMLVVDRIVGQTVLDTALKAVRKHFWTNGWYPYAAAYGQGTGTCVNNQRSGLLPITHGGTCASPNLRDNTLGSDKLPDWFVNNRWDRVLYYSVDQFCTRGNNCASPYFLLRQDGQERHVLLAFAGRRRNTQNRIANPDVADYLDSTVNTDGNDVYLSSPFPLSNDLLTGYMSGLMDIQLTYDVLQQAQVYQNINGTINRNLASNLASNPDNGLLSVGGGNLNALGCVWFEGPEYKALLENRSLRMYTKFYMSHMLANGTLVPDIDNEPNSMGIGQGFNFTLKQGNHPGDACGGTVRDMGFNGMDGRSISLEFDTRPNHCGWERNCLRSGGSNYSAGGWGERYDARNNMNHVAIVHDGNNFHGHFPYLPTGCVGASLCTNQSAKWGEGNQTTKRYCNWYKNGGSWVFSDGQDYGHCPETTWEVCGTAGGPTCAVSSADNDGWNHPNLVTKSHDPTKKYYSKWASNVTYTDGETIYYQGRDYTSLRNSNLNNNPLNSTTHWEDSTNPPCDPNKDGAAYSDSAHVLYTYSAATTYAKGAHVQHNGVKYISLRDGNLGHQPPDPRYWQANTGCATDPRYGDPLATPSVGWLEDGKVHELRFQLDHGFEDRSCQTSITQWRPYVDYLAGEKVQQSGVLYVATAANSNEEPPGAHWQSGAWNAATAYTVGAKVSYNGLIYEAIQNHTGQTPTTATHWKEFKPYVLVRASVDCPVPSNTTSSIDRFNPPVTTRLCPEMNNLSRDYYRPPQWSAERTYDRGEAASLNGTVYTAMATTTGENPATTPARWETGHRTPLVQDCIRFPDELRGDVNNPAHAAIGHFGSLFGFTTGTGGASAGVNANIWDFHMTNNY